MTSINRKTRKIKKSKNHDSVMADEQVIKTSDAEMFRIINNRNFDKIVGKNGFTPSQYFSGQLLQNQLFMPNILFMRLG